MLHIVQGQRGPDGPRDWAEPNASAVGPVAHPSGARLDPRQVDLECDLLAALASAIEAFDSSGSPEDAEILGDALARWAFAVAVRPPSHVARLELAMGLLDRQ